MGAGHNHVVSKGHEKNLFITLGLTTVYMIAEIVGGLLTGSLALLADAAHMFTDVTALAISLVAIWIGKRAADQSRTYGYYRFEILAAAFNAVILFLVAGYIIYEAVKRFQSPPEIQSGGMLTVAIIGLIVNFIGLRLLQAGSDSSLNVKGAYLEVWSDLLGSLGVIIAAILIRYTGWWQADPIIAMLIGLWVLPRTWTLLKQSINILLEGVPEGIELIKIEQALKEIPGIKDIHDLHVWAITSGKTSLTAHILIDKAEADLEQITLKANSLLKERFDISHSTLQIEMQNCESQKDDCFSHD